MSVTQLAYNQAHQNMEE